MGSSVGGPMESLMGKLMGSTNEEGTMGRTAEEGRRGRGGG